MTSPLRLRPLREDDEAAFRAALAAMTADDFTFGYGLEPGMAWSSYLKIADDERRGLNLTGDHVANTFLVAEIGGVIVGRTSIRHELNDFLRREGGHIGYCVLPGYRRRGYATEILRQSLIVGRAVGIDRALLTCDDSNAGSIAVIEGCGGVLERVSPAGPAEAARRYYWID